MLNHEIIKPRAVKTGETVGIVAPSDWFSTGRFFQGVREIESWGLKVKFGEHIFERIEDFMAGDALIRGEDLQRMIYDDQVRVIWAAEGGYAAADIRGYLGEKEFSHLRENPKWFIGFSDIGVLTNAFLANGLVSIYGPNVWGLTYWKKRTRAAVRDILFGEKIDYPKSGRVIIDGTATGRLLASNLDSLYANLGTRFDPLLFGEGDLILALEEWRYDLSDVLRQFEAIFDHARFGRVKGLILGRFPQPMENSYSDWVKTVDLISQVRDRLLSRRSLPMVTVPYFGHPSVGYDSVGKNKEESYPMPNGVRIRLSGTKGVSISCLESVSA